LVGAILACVGSVLLLKKTVQNDNSALGVVAVSLYCGCLIICFAMSALYHFMPNLTVRRSVFRRLDHCSIALFIAGTYAPFMLIGLGGALGVWIACIELGLAVLIITFNAINVRRFSLVSLIAYVIMGWLVLPAIMPSIRNMGGIAFVWLLIGGVFYTIGILFYKLKSLPFNHAIWHMFVLAGAIFMYVSMFFYVV
jgi:hemolysin III